MQLLQVWACILDLGIGEDGMTEKRFVGSSGGVYDRYKQDRFVWSEWEEIIRIMNNLNEKARERSKALSKLEKENEQLKSEINMLKTTIGRNEGYIDRLTHKGEWR